MFGCAGELLGAFFTRDMLFVGFGGWLISDGDIFAKGDFFHVLREGDFIKDKFVVVSLVEEGFVFDRVLGERDVFASHLFGDFLVLFQRVLQVGLVLVKCVSEDSLTILFLDKIVVLFLHLFAVELFVEEVFNHRVQEDKIVDAYVLDFLWNVIERQGWLVGFEVGAEEFFVNFMGGVVNPLGLEELGGDFDLEFTLDD